MKITVIGASGFLGSSLSKFLSEFHSVNCMDIRSIYTEAFSLQKNIVDVINDNIQIPHGTEIVIYLSQSPFYHGQTETVPHLFGVNNYGAIKAITSAVKSKARLFIYASTGNVYSPSFAPLKETDKVRKNDFYALSKISTEETLKLFQNYIDVLSLRFFGIFGPQQTTMLPYNILISILNEHPIFLQPSPHTKNGIINGLCISFIYLYDAIRMFESLISLYANGYKLPEVVNVGGPDKISLRLFANTIGNIIKKKPIFVVKENNRAFDLIADITLLLQTIKSFEFTPFDDAMSNSYKDYKLNLKFNV